MTQDPQLRKGNIERCNRLVLAHTIFRIAYEETEVFGDFNVGVDLAYLMGAVVDMDNPFDSFVDWRPESYGEGRPRPDLFRILAAAFPQEHVIWEFIVIPEDWLAEIIR